MALFFTKERINDLFVAAFQVMFAAVFLFVAMMVFFLASVIWCNTANWRSEQYAQAEATRIMFVARAQREADLIKSGKLNFELIKCADRQCDVSPQSASVEDSNNG